MRFNLPYAFRSPWYKARIERRLRPLTPSSAHRLARADKWTGPVARDLERRAQIAAYRRADFLGTSPDVYLPPDGAIPRPPGRWRWWRDPVVIGSAIGFAVMCVALVAIYPS